MKITKTVVPTFPRAGAPERYTIAGLPRLTAVVYVSYFAIALALYGVLWPSAPIIVSDSPSYLRVAQDLLHSKIGQERTPGYPLLLVLTASAESPNRALFFVSVLFHCVSIWLLGVALFRGGLRAVPLCLFGFLLLLPPYVEPAGYVLSENLAELLIVVAFVGFVFWVLYSKGIWILISAFAVGSAALVRPTYQFLPLFMVGYLAVTSLLFPSPHSKGRELIKAAVIMMCGSLLLIGGYAFINYRSFGYFGVTPRLGLSLSTKTWRFTERLPDEYGPIRTALINARNEQLVLEGSEHDGSMSIWTALPELTKITELPYKPLSDYMLKLNLLLIQKAPLNYFREVVWAFGSYWFPSSTSLANFKSRPIQLLWATLHFLLTAIFALGLLILLGAGIFIQRSKLVAKQLGSLLANDFRVIRLQALIYGMAGTIVFYTAAVSCLVEVGDPRYRVPTDSLIAFMVFLATDLWSRLTTRANAVV